MRTVEDPAAVPAGGVFVPTMGALHAGHAALVRRACQERENRGGRAPVVVSVFVNPTQFNDPKDLERYPRTLEADERVCRDAGADVVFAPSVETVYPEAGVAVPAMPGVAMEPGLEDAHRPGHFGGVCQVVNRLFELVRPSAAVFGEKDWQQLQVIRAMCGLLATGGMAQPEIVSVATVREADGLAMSSRNVFLSSADRRHALAISRALCEAAGCETPEEAERAMREMMEREGGAVRVQYAVVRDAETLGRVREGRACRALIAAGVGSVRLIDNAAWGWAKV